MLYDISLRIINICQKQCKNLANFENFNRFYACDYLIHLGLSYIRKYPLHLLVTHVFRLNLFSTYIIFLLSSPENFTRYCFCAKNWSLDIPFILRKMSHQERVTLLYFLSLTLFLKIRMKTIKARKNVRVAEESIIHPTISAKTWNMSDGN